MAFDWQPKGEVGRKCGKGQNTTKEGGEEAGKMGAAEVVCQECKSRVGDE